MHTRKPFALALVATGLFSLAAIIPTAQAEGFSPQEFKYCKADVQRLCKGISPGEGRLMECLKAHEDSLTVGCAKELKALKSKMNK